MDWLKDIQRTVINKDKYDHITEILLLGKTSKVAQRKDPINLSYSPVFDLSLEHISSTSSDTSLDITPSHTPAIPLIMLDFPNAINISRKT